MQGLGTEIHWGSVREAAVPAGACYTSSTSTSRFVILVGQEEGLFGKTDAESHLLVGQNLGRVNEGRSECGRLVFSARIHQVPRLEKRRRGEKGHQDEDMQMLFGEDAAPAVRGAREIEMRRQWKVEAREDGFLEDRGVDEVVLCDSWLSHVRLAGRTTETLHFL
jgi:hypothetical protein